MISFFKYSGVRKCNILLIFCKLWHQANMLVLLRRGPKLKPTIIICFIDLLYTTHFSNYESCSKLFYIKEENKGISNYL